MPVTVTETVATYAGNGSTTVPYPITIPRDQDEDLILTINGVTSTDFSVSPDGFRTGTAISSGSALVLFRRTPRTQVQSFPSNTTPAAEDVRAGLDKLTLGVQEIDEEVGRAIKSPVGEVFASDRTIGIASTGLPIARTAAEEVTFLGIGVSVTDASNSATAAATSASNAATSASYAATFETNAALAVASVLDLSDQAFFKAWFYPDPFAGDPVITGDVVISLPGSPNITIKNSARPYAEDNAINGVGSKVSQLFWDIVNIIKGNVTDYDTSTKYGVGQTTVSNYNPITTWDAKVEPYGNGLTDNSIEPVVTLTYYGPGEGVTLTLPTGLLTNPGTFSPPTAVPFVTHTTAQTLTNAQKLQARDNIGVSAITLDVSAAPFNAALDWNGTTGTDDTAAIQSALDYAATEGARGKNCHVVIPGRAKTSGTLYVYAHNGFRLSGVGGPQASGINSTSPLDVLAIRMPSVDGLGFCEHLVIENLSLEGVGCATATGSILNTTDTRAYSEHYNGGGLHLRNLRIGALNKGGRIGLNLKRWDATTVENCRIQYNYRNVVTSSASNTIYFVGGGNAQAESLLWDFGIGAKVQIHQMDNGNSPQFARVGYGSIVAFHGGNYETTRFSTTATQKYPVATTTYPSLATVTAINTTTGLITTSGNHGFKPGCFVNFHYNTLPAGLTGFDFYEILADGFTATTFKIKAKDRSGTATTGGVITLTNASTTNTDLEVGGKVLIGTFEATSGFTPGEYFIKTKEGTTAITVSATSAVGTTATFPVAGDVTVTPITALIPTTAGSGVLVEASVFAVDLSASLNLSNIQVITNGSVTSALATVGIGSTIYLNGTIQSSGFTGDNGGKIVSAFSSGIIIPSTRTVSNGLRQRQSTRSLILDYAPNTSVVLADNSGSTGNLANYGQLIWKMPRSGLLGGASLFASTKNQLGAHVLEPVLNSAARNATAITNGTTADPYELKMNGRYSVNLSTGATVGLVLPDDLTVAARLTARSLTLVSELPADERDDESVTVGDEITVHVYGTGGQVVDIKQSGPNQYIKLGATLSTNGSAFGLRLNDGAGVTLKCYSVAGSGYWQVVESTGTIAHF